MKNTTPPFIVNDDILTAGPTRQLLMRWKNGKKECAPRSSSTIICTPTMAGGEYTCDEREWFCHGAVQVRYVCYKVYSFFPIIHHLFSPCRHSLHKKNFSVSKFRMSLASMLYSRLDMFISLWKIHLFEEFLNFWREKKKRGNIIIMK